MQLQQILDVLQNLNDDDFVELANKVDAQRQKRAQDILNKANRQAEILSGGSLATSGKPSRRSLAPKYADPKTGKTWSGQGRQPKWFLEHLDKGGKEEDLLI